MAAIPRLVTVGFDAKFAAEVKWRDQNRSESAEVCTWDRSQYSCTAQGNYLAKDRYVVVLRAADGQARQAADRQTWSANRGDKLNRVQRLLDALRNDRSSVPLDIAALEIASIEFPGVDAEAAGFRLDHLAAQIDAQLSGTATALDFIRASNELLFDVLQFRGNEEDYYDPRNCCLNSVLMRRLGIPISLSVVYMEVARRLRRPVYGVGLPGHFIVVYEDADAHYWIDPFHGGRILSFADCAALAKQTAGVDLRSNPAVLAPVSNRQILVRILSNLKSIYLRGEAFEKARQVLDLLIEAMPDYAEEYRHRGLVHLRQLNHRAAKADLETYLRLEPDSPESEKVKKQLVLIERWKAGLN